jgi:hypothetical protein
VFLLKLLLCVCLFGLLTAGSLENIPTDSWVYDDVDLLKTAGLIHSMPSTSRPWTRAEAGGLVQEADSAAAFRDMVPGIAAALERLRTEFAADVPLRQVRTGSRRAIIRIPVPAGDQAQFRMDGFSRAGTRRWNGRTDIIGSIGTVLSNRPGSDFAFYERAEFTMFHPDTIDIVDSAGKHVSGTRVGAWMDLGVFQIDHAYLAFRIPWLRLEFGRDKFRWGPGYVSSCMLSDHAPGLDHVQLCASYRDFKYLSFTSYLSRWGLKHRFLSAQRIEYSFLDRVTLGGALMSAYSWDSLQTRAFFGMMNPIIPVFFEVAGSGHDDNLLVGWDAVVHLPRCKAYGQLFMDNYEFVKREGQPPNAIAWQVGAYWVPDLPVSVRVEYSRVNPFTYYHRIHHIMYEQYGVPLGHRLGPDADQVYCRLGFVLWAPLDVGIVGAYTRRGYYNRGDFTRLSWYGGQPLPEQFPSELGDEKVERETRVQAEAQVWLGRDLRVLGDVAYWYRQNVAGTPDNRDGFDFTLRIEFRY